MESWEKWVHSPSHDRAFLHLKELSIEDCPSLEGELPPHLPSLTKLIIKDCKELISFSLQSVPLLEVLESRRCNVIFNDGGGWCSDEGAEFVNIPCELAHLTTLKIEECRSPISEGLLLPDLQYLEFKDCKNMESLPSQLHKYTSLKTLKIFKCPKIQEIPEGGLPINLEQLTIEDVNIKQRVQELAMHHLHSLRFLNLKNVGMTPEDLSLPSSLYQLTISGSENLKTISSCTTLPNLTLFLIRDCPVFKSLIGMFTSNLIIENCPNFEFSAEGGLPRNLISLVLWGTMNRDKPIREWGLHLLSSLNSLTLAELGRSTTEAVECIPSPNLLLPSSSLTRLTISGFQDLKSIDCSSFPNLITLWINNCPKFESFGDHGLPPKLQRMEIQECESLKPHLKIDPHGPILMDKCKYSLL